MLILTGRSAVNVVRERRASREWQSGFHIVAGAADHDRRIWRRRFHVPAQTGHGKVGALGHRRGVGHGRIARTHRVLPWQRRTDR